MRQVFTSSRLENAEGVARLLEEHQIEVRITNGRSYKGNRRGNFSYRDNGSSAPRPAVWVVKSEDQPRARELLREAGLLDSGRSPTSYLQVPTRDEDAAPKPLAQRAASRIKLGLLIGMGIVIAMALMRSF